MVKYRHCQQIVTAHSKKYETLGHAQALKKTEMEVFDYQIVVP